MPETTTQSGPPPWYQQMLQGFYPGAFNIANRPYQQYQGPQVAGMSSITQNALNGVQGSMYGTPATQAGNQFLTGLLGNSSNPYIDQMASSITSDANRQMDSRMSDINSIFSNPNSFGTSRHGLAVGDAVTDFGKGIASSLGNLRYGAFNDDLNRRMAATSLAESGANSNMNRYMQGAQAGDIPRQIQQQFYDQGQRNFNDWRNYPQQQASWLGGMFGVGNPGSQSTQTTPNPNPWSQAAGGIGLIGSGLGWFR